MDELREEKFGAAENIGAAAAVLSLGLQVKKAIDDRPVKPKPKHRETKRG
jgi:hypothetical protein